VLATRACAPALAACPLCGADEETVEHFLVACPALDQQRAQLAATLAARLGQIDGAVLGRALALLRSNEAADALSFALGPLWALGLQPPPCPSRRERVLQSIRLSAADDRTRAALEAQSRHGKFVRAIVERTTRNYVHACWRFRLAAKRAVQEPQLFI